MQYLCHTNVKRSPQNCHTFATKDYIFAATININIFSNGFIINSKNAANKLEM